jgi:hypothetical protein
MIVFKGSFPLVAKTNSQARCVHFHPITMPDMQFILIRRKHSGLRVDLRVEKRAIMQYWDIWARAKFPLYIYFITGSLSLTEINYIHFHMC